MSDFNCPEFVKEFAGYVQNLKVDSALEVGCLSGELKDAVKADGIDIAPERADVEQVDIREYAPKKKYDLVFSSGLLEYYSADHAVDVLKAMAKASKKYVLTYVPNAKCEAYKEYKASTTAEWRGEDDYTQAKLAGLHRMAGMEVVETGTAARQWVKRFNGVPGEEGYLVYCLAKVGGKKWKSNTPAESAIQEG